MPSDRIPQNLCSDGILAGHGGLEGPAAWVLGFHRTNTYSLVPVSVVSKKSAARIACLGAQECRPGGAGALGAGSIPASWRISQTVEAVTETPCTSSSLWILRYPHEVFSRARRGTSRRIDRMVGGRPACLGPEILACRWVIRSRCQRSTVSGRTSRRRLRSTPRVAGEAGRRARPGQLG